MTAYGLSPRYLDAVVKTQKEVRTSQEEDEGESNLLWSLSASRYYLPRCLSIFPTVSLPLHISVHLYSLVQFLKDGCMFVVLIGRVWPHRVVSRNFCLAQRVWLDFCAA